MPVTKLTLSLPLPVIKEAKVYAQRQGKSLSALVTAYFKTISKSSAARGASLASPRVKRVTGIARARKRRGDRDVLTEALLEKYT